jgi:hypothetical protein
MVEFGFALYLDMHEHKVTWGKGGSRMAGIIMVMVGLAMVGNNGSNNLASKIDMLGSVFDVFKGGGARVGQGPNRRGERIKGEVKGKFELPTHGKNAASNDIGVINGAAIPSVGGDNGSFDPYKVGAAV